MSPDLFLAWARLLFASASTARPMANEMTEVAFGCLYSRLGIGIGIASPKYQLFGWFGIQNWNSNPIPSGIHRTGTHLPPIPSRTPSYSLALFFSVVSRIFVAFSSSPSSLSRFLSGEPCCPSCGPPPLPPPLPSLWVAAPPLPFLFSGEPRRPSPSSSPEIHLVRGSPGGPTENWRPTRPPPRRGSSSGMGKKSAGPRARLLDGAEQETRVARSRKGRNSSGVEKNGRGEATARWWAEAESRVCFSLLAGVCIQFSIRWCMHPNTIWYFSSRQIPSTNFISIQTKTLVLNPMPKLVRFGI